MPVENYDREYLSQSGLSTLWNKIKSIFLAKSDAGTLTETLNITDYFQVSDWVCTTVPPLYDLIYTQHKDVVIVKSDMLYRLEKSSYEYIVSEFKYVYIFSYFQSISSQSYGAFNERKFIKIIIPASANPQPSDVSLTEYIVDNARMDHSHGNLRNDGKSSQSPTNTASFLRADGTWEVPDNIERSMYEANPFNGVKFCTTRVSAALSTAYGVFRFSLVKFSGSGTTGTGPTTGIIQVFHRTDGDGVSSIINARITENQPDYNGGLNPGLSIKYVLRDGDTVDWYIASHNSLYDTRIGLCLIHKFNNSSTSVTPLDPVVEDTSNFSTASGGGYKTPVMLESSISVGTPGKPVCITNGLATQCEMMGADSSDYLLYSIYPNPLVNDTTGLYFAMQTDGWVNGGYLSLSDVKKKIHGTSIGSQSSSGVTPVYVRDDIITASDYTAGNNFKHIYFRSGSIYESSEYVRSIVCSANINLTAGSYSSMPAYAIVVVGNNSTGSVQVIYKTDGTYVTIPSKRCRVFIRYSADGDYTPDY